MKIDYQFYKDYWKKFFTSKEFEFKGESEDVLTFKGFNPEIRIQVYAGSFRTDTDTGGCICADFDKDWNKVSQCPIYFDLNVTEEEVLKAIEKLKN